MSYDIFKNIKIKQIEKDLYLFIFSYKASNIISKKNLKQELKLNKKELLKELNILKNELKTDVLKDLNNKGVNKINKIIKSLK